MSTYDSENIETGELLMRSPLTDTVYLVTRWMDSGDGNDVRALEKEALSEPPHDYALDGVEGLDTRPRGPLGDEPSDTPTTAAIGFCPRCGDNCRATTAIRGLFVCRWSCGYQWSDERVGEQERSFGDYFVEVDA
ncbi:hypothetical protein NDI85_19935 [Halomicroarcula sp. S1AR25-4]|uniref:hypothetical protein n=1 Tax=Haloarcula sp. S1AR25-4 TaxID=2950538 RepID=UPI00287440EF|nr:hypothetical protein [Halomicroarcula sp. S1AR25-4]MDS0280059.1 hypothetical protein [Halomicroarcula sp. S1AR25-4]